jgi:hypothetical protein
MTDEAMSPLRRRMIEDMTIRKLSPKTQQGYIRTIKEFAAFVGRSPDTASFEDVRRFQLHLAANGAHVPILDHTVAALRFFFRVTLKRPDIIEHTTFIHEPRKLPVVLSTEEVARLLAAAPGLKYKAALSVAYGAGLRAASGAQEHPDDDQLLLRSRNHPGERDLYRHHPQPLGGGIIRHDVPAEPIDTYFWCAQAPAANLSGRATPFAPGSRMAALR